MEARRFDDLLSRVEADARRLLATAYAPKSRGPVKAALAAFADFAACTPSRVLFHTPLTQPGWSTWAIQAWNEWTMILWATFMTKRASPKTGRPVKADTIKQYASLLKGFFSFTYAFSVVDQAPRLSALLKQLTSSDPLGGVRRKRRALRRRHLRKLWRSCPAVSAQDADTLNLWAATVLSWHALARGGELSGPDGPKRADLTFGADGQGRRWACVMLSPLKKRGQRRAPAVPQFILEHDGGGSDAYTALARLDSLDPVDEDQRVNTPLFRVRGRRNGSTAMSVSHFRAWVQRLGSHELGLGSAREWGAHSGRIGGATDLAATGEASALLLQAKGRWASDIGRIYARMTRRAHLAASALMQRAKGRDIEELIPSFVQPA